MTGSVTIEELPSIAEPLEGTDALPVSRGGLAYKLTIESILAAVAELIGEDIQAWSPSLDTFSGLSQVSNGVLCSDGTTWVVRSGSTLRTSIGLGTTDSPQFTSIQLGHSADTTLSRIGAGGMAIENNVVPSPSGQVQGDILYRGATRWERLAKGVTGQVLKQGASDAPEWAASGMTLFESAPQTITAGGLLTLAHGLGKRPAIILPYLKCLSSNLGYAVDDCVEMGQGWTSVNASRGFGLWSDTTNVYVRFGSASPVFQLFNKSSGAGATGTVDASWNLVVRALA